MCHVETAVLTVRWPVRTSCRVVELSRVSSGGKGGGGRDGQDNTLAVITAELPARQGAGS